jgi:hypothetical protein
VDRPAIDAGSTVVTVDHTGKPAVRGLIRADDMKAKKPDEDDEASPAPPAAAGEPSGGVSTSGGRISTSAYATAMPANQHTRNFLSVLEVA